MVSTTFEVNRAVKCPIETPVDVSMGRISELAQVYILDGPRSLSDADLYLANKALLNKMAGAEERGLTPRDMVLSLLRPVLNSDEHCRCPSCRIRCLVCKSAAEEASGKVSY